MQARHALQAAAKQFGLDGTDKSLEVLFSAFDDYRFAQSVAEEPEIAAGILNELAGETILTIHTAGAAR